MKIILAALVTLLMSVSAAQAKEEDVISAVGALNEASVEWLGVSLGAISYLSQIEATSFMPKDYLSGSDKMPLIIELEKAGYVVIHERKGLPDGHEPENTFLNLRPTESGLKIIATIKVITRRSMSPAAGQP